MWCTQGELERARTGLNRALTLPTAPATWMMVAQAENVFGHVEHAAGDTSAARDRFAHSIDVFRALAIPSGLGLR